MTVPTSKQGDRARIVWALISAPTVLVALLYLMGRQYIQSYYSAAGVQPSFLRFQTADYLYFGANWVILVFAFFYVVLAYHIGRYMFYDYTADQAAQESKEPLLNQIRFFFSMDKSFFWVMVFVFGVSAYTVLVMAMHGLSQQTTDIETAMAQWFVFLLIGLLGTVFLRDSITVSFLKRSTLLRTLVLGIMAVLVFMMPYVGVSGWGSSMGASDTSASQIDKVFPTIVFTSDQPVIQEFDWKRTDQGYFQTEGKLYLLLENDGRLFVRPDGKGNETVVVTADSFSAYHLNFKSPGELPKAKK